jgi:hypothetical protein
MVLQAEGHEHRPVFRLSQKTAILMTEYCTHAHPITHPETPRSRIGNEGMRRLQQLYLAAILLGSFRRALTVMPYRASLKANKNAAVMTLCEILGPMPEVAKTRVSKAFEIRELYSD